MEIMPITIITSTDRSTRKMRRSPATLAGVIAVRMRALARTRTNAALPDKPACHEFLHERCQAGAIVYISRFAHGFTLLANYTYSKTIDTQSSDQQSVGAFGCCIGIFGIADIVTQN